MYAYSSVFIKRLFATIESATKIFMTFCQTATRTNL